VQSQAMTPMVYPERQSSERRSLRRTGVRRRKPGGFKQSQRSITQRLFQRCRGHHDEVNATQIKLFGRAQICRRCSHVGGVQADHRKREEMAH